MRVFEGESPGNGDGHWATARFQLFARPLGIVRAGQANRSEQQEAAGPPRAPQTPAPSFNRSTLASLPPQMDAGAEFLRACASGTAARVAGQNLLGGIAALLRVRLATPQARANPTVD